jgi:predicted amidophosphoribosyltransferase
MTVNRRAHAATPTETQATADLLPRDYRLQYAASYVYSPKGESEVSQRSRLMCARVKNGSPKWLKTYVARVHQELTQKRCFRDFFTERTLFVPVPQCRSSPLPSLWVARRLAFALYDAGLGEEVWTGLRRVSAVERSSSAWMWHRPTVLQHYRSLTVIPSSRSPAHIILIDDVITKGRTFVAAAMRLREAFPAATIRAFALVRTMGFVDDVVRLFEPCEGAIQWNGTDAYRDP